MDISHTTNHSSSVSTQLSHEVFLNFRGPDTRKDFVDCLYTMLTYAGIRVFRDEEGLEKGEGIKPQLIKAIEQSKISIAIISKNYADSKSCLMELEQMLKCMDEKGHIIIPIFYYVDPWNVRHSKGIFGKSLRGHGKRKIDGSIIDSWTSALHRVGELKGHHLHETSRVHHGELIKQIVFKVQQKLKKEDLVVAKQLVGVDRHVQNIMAKLRVDYRNGQAVKIGATGGKVLGIYGIPGLGKTVLAKYVYNQLSHLFEACSFLEKIPADIRHQSDFVSVQNKLISDLHKGNAQKFDCSDKALIYIRDRFCTLNVLILLDDVNDHKQLSTLVGGLDWLSPQSRVILTSQNRDVLTHINGRECFVLEMMEQDDALKLFCRHAFKNDTPREGFDKLSREIVHAIGGLPLELELLGSSLFLVKSKKKWKAALTRLREAPLDERVLEALKTSYNKLNKNERKIFLDIACFFIGKDKRIPYYMWDDCDCYPSLSMTALRARSLVAIGEDKELSMHKVLKKFGQEIVMEENPDEPSKRSRLCNHEEALHVLKKREGTGKVEALGLQFGDGSEENISFECDHFVGLDKLRFLKLDRADIRGNFGDCLSSLRWLDWQGCPKSFDDQSLDLNLQNLVILDLSGSQFKRDWKGWKQLFGKAKKLKVLKLTGCVQLNGTPEFPLRMELKILILEGCSNLGVVNRSFRNLNNLVSLNMKQCSRLYKLPELQPMRGLKELVMDGTSITEIDFPEGSIRKLKYLSARDCEKLNKISDSIRYLKSLKYLALDGSKIRTLRGSIGSLEKLKTLSLKNCQSLTNLPNEIGKLRSLRFLDLSHTLILKLPSSVKDLTAMKVLRMRATFIPEFPEDILNIEKLQEIDFSLCRSLRGEIHGDIQRLSSLETLRLSDTQISGLPASISRLSCLRELDISRCYNLRCLPELPSSINVLRDDN